MKSFCLRVPGRRGSFALLFFGLVSCLSVAATPPAITQEPERANVIQGDDARFQVIATGTEPLSYQWRFSSTNLPNATNAILLLQNVQTNQAGGYQVVVSNAEGSTTSVVAQLVVRPPGTSIYLPPPGGWTYRFEGDGIASSGTAALDGTWNHNNGTDAWAGDWRGVENPPAGGLSVTNGILTLEDVVVSGAGDDNRRLYFTHVLSQDPVTNANTILNDGVTLTFRARLTPPTDPLTELTNAPNGFINVSDGKGMIGVRQSGSSGMIISFSLNMEWEDTNATTLYQFPAAGLHMNNLNGNSRTDRVDPGEAGTLNVFPVNPESFHEFWITIEDNGADPGTHRVSVYADGSTTPSIFNVTAGIGVDSPITNYLAIGLPSAIQRGAFDLDWVGYKQGVHVPAAGDVPVEIISQPASQSVDEGQTATFSVDVIGTPPITFQWFRNGVAISGATGSSYTTGPLLPSDSGAVFTVECENSAGSVTSDPATLTVITDNVPPALVSAASLNGQNIGVCFSERVTESSAQNIANYTVNNGLVTVTSATLRTNANGTTVLLQVSGLGSTADTVFTVRATNIVDGSFAGNSGGGTVQGVVHGLTPANIGVASGASFTCASNRFEIASGGAGMGGTADGFHFASMPRTGDFDVRVRLARLDATNAAGQGGLVARVDQTAGSRSVNLFATPLPGDNAYHATYRTTAGGGTLAWPGGSDKPGVPLPNAWIRLTRAGDTFTAYHGTNGTEWQAYAQLTEALPATLLVGIAGANLADSILDEFTFIPPPQIVTQPASVVATNGDTVVFSVVATSKAEIWYQWLAGATPIPGETNATLVLANVHPSQAGTYQVRVANGGGSLLSAPATLTVRALDYGDAPAAYPTLLANSGARHVLASGMHLGAAVDFELDGFPGEGATGDDLNGVDDEDGVTFRSPLWVDQTAVIAVIASTQGVLNAWIDYGADGSFAQAEDHVFLDYGLEPGTNLLSLIVPFDAVGTNTFARFRFSSIGGLGPDGIAPDGEVEDYSVAIIPVADISITATDSPDPIAAGSNLTYQVTVRNVGPAIANGVLVTNSFSSSVEFVSATSTQGGCVNNAGTITCAIGDLGLSATATITVTVRPQQAGSLSGMFGIDADQPDPNLGDNAVTVITTVELAPVITTPPSSLTVTQHNSATFSVTATGTAPLVYQWFHNGAALENRTNASLVIADALNAHQGNYQVRITNRVGGTFSEPVTLTVLDPPVIVQPPQSRTNFAGSTANFAVVASGTPPLSYQWLFNGGNLSGETNASLMLPNVQKSQAGVYSVRAANAAGMVESAGAVLTVIEMDFGDAAAPFPTLLADNGARHRIRPGFYLGAGVDFEPDGQANDGSDEDGVAFLSGMLLSQSARLDVTASSNGVLNAWVDWNGNGSWADAGEQIFTNRTLAAGINNLTVAVPLNAQLGARAARFRFSTASGLTFTGESADGEVEDYVVNVQPAIDLRVSVTADPATVELGSNVVYNIFLTNAGPSSANGVVVTSSLPASVTIVGLHGGCTSDAGLVVCNLGSVGSTNLQITARPTQAGAVTNVLSVSANEADFNVSNNVAHVVVSVLEFPVITSHPQSATVVSGDSATFQVTASGTALSYQWTFNSSDIAGATNAMLIISPAQPSHAGAYRVRVSNALGQVTSDPAQLTVLVPPTIVSQPASVSVNAGASATFSVTASGTTPLFYQWTFGGADLPAATNATLTITNVGAANEGTYRVRVSNAAGAVLSDAATLVVQTGVAITQQPISQMVFAGSTASLQVVASGSQPISYQWFFNTTNRLTGGTNATLVISNVQVSHSGQYTVLISNEVNTVTSAPATLTVREADFGDAQGPSYATLLVFNGAYHYLSPGVHLGTRVDFEPDGQPTADASGDDLAGQDDEDGVAFVLPLLAGQPAQVNVMASTNGFLDAWLDFNGNGDWTDSGEQIFVSRPLVAGTNALQFTVPQSALAHGALSRFRFSTAGGLFFSGGAPDGEVEDHVAPISAAVDLSVTLVDQPDPVAVGTTVNLFATVSNSGPSTATAVVLRQQLPPSAAFISATLSQGSCSNDAGVLICNLGAIPAGGRVTADVALLPQGIGLEAHRVEVSSPEYDLNASNNMALEVTTVVTAFGPFRNATPIAINDSGPASIYPSTITVSGVTGSVHSVIVTFHNFSHLYPDDIDMLLVGPGGQRVIIMSDAGGGFDPGYVTFSLDDASDLILPDERLIIDEVYQPADYDDATDTDVFNAPAPGAPYTNRLAAFRGTDANGVWSLFIMDDFALDNGELAGGWSLDFLVLDPIADASVGIAASPNPAAVGQNLTYTISVTNGGPSAASQMFLTNVLPANVTLQSFTPSQGACANAAGQITCDLGLMVAGGTASLTVAVTPQQVGVLSNYVRVAPSQLDVSPTNNTASLLTQVRYVADISLTMADSQDPVSFGQPFTYTLTVSNHGPQLGQALVLSNVLPAGFSFTGATTTRGSCSQAGGIVTCNLGDIGPGSNAVIQITGQANAIARITNSASVTGNSFDANQANNVRSEETVLVFTAPAVMNTSGISPPNPYPSTLQVSGLTGIVYKVVAIISNITHTTPENLKLLLVGPAGQNVLLMNSVGGTPDISNVTIRLDDQAASLMPDSTRLDPGTYRPTSYTTPSSFAAPAPPAPYGGALVSFRGTDGNGTWSLFTSGGGTIGAWGLQISTLEGIADLSVNVVSQPATISVSSNLAYIVTVSNGGPAIASGIVLSNLLPASFSVTSATGCTNICNIGSLTAGSQIQFRVDGVALAEGTATNRVSAFASQLDLNPSNNVAVAVTTMKTPPIISSQPQSVTVTNGVTATFSVGVTGAGPFTYQWLHNGSAVPGGTNSSLVISNAQQTNAGDYAVRVSDGVGSPLSAAARLTVLNRPTISDIPNITILEDTASAEIPFVIGDLESSVLNLEIASSNQQLIPIANVLISGAGSNRTVRVLPATNQFGLATITITVRDGHGIPASDAFDVNVLAVNDPPVLGAVANQTMDEDTQRSILLQASDVEDAPSQLSLTAFASNTNLIAVTLLDRTLTIAGLPDQFGTARLTVILADSGGIIVSNVFDVLVNPINDPPTLDPIERVVLEEDAGNIIVPLTGISAGPANESQTVTVTASTADTNIVDALTVNYTSGSSGSLNFRTVLNKTGSTTITVTVNDGGASNNIVSRTFAVNIGDVNDLPDISAVADQVTAEDTPFQVEFTISDDETPPDQLTVTASSSNTNLVQNGSLNVQGTNATRTLLVTPEPNASGSTFITISVSDGIDTTTRSFQARVSAVNDPPTLDVDSVLSLPENSSPEIVALRDIGAGAPDEPNDLLIIAVSSDPFLVPDPVINYSSPDTSGTLTLTPQAGAVGSAVITIVVNDRGASNNIVMRTLTVIISDQNNPPTFSRIFNQTTPEDTAIEIPFAVFDAESAADTLSLSVISSNPSLIPNDALTITGAGTNRTIRAVPAPNASGTANITLAAADPGGASNAVTFVLVVSAANDRPTITDIPDQQVIEDIGLLQYFFYVNDLETSANSLIVSAFSTNPWLVPQSRILLGGSGTNRWIRILPWSNRSGLAEITIMVRDAEGLTASDTFMLNVQPTNDPPVISAIANQNVLIGTSAAVPFTVNDQETDPNALILTVSSSNPAVLPGTNIVLAGSAANRSLLVTPLPNVTGTSIVSIVVRDEAGATASTSFNVQVNSGTGAPVILAHPENQTADVGGTASFAVSAMGSPVLRYRWLFYGTNLPSATNYTLVFTNVTASDAGPYSVIVVNGFGGATSVVARLTVNGGTTPTISAIPDQNGLEDTPLTLSLGLQDLDTPAHFLTLSATSTNTNLIPPGNYFFDGSGFNRTLTIVPAINQFGTNLVTVTVADGAASSSRSFVLRVAAVNDPPTLDRVDNISTLAGTAVSVPLTGISPGAPNETTIVNITAVHNNPNVLTNLSINYSPGASSGSLSVSVLSNATGSATITITANDGGPSTLRTFQILVRSPGNSNPLIFAPTNIVVAEDTSSGPVPFTVDDPGSTPGQVTITAFSHNTNVVTSTGILIGGSGANRTITLTPNTNQSGTSLITLTATDSAAGVATTNFSFTVLPVNDLPVLGPMAAQTLAEDTPTVVAIAVRDTETPASALVLSASSSNPTLIPNANLLFGGSGSNRVLVLQAVTGQTGSAVITITLTDLDGGSVSSNFTATVVNVNDSPQISDVPDVTIPMDTSTGPIPFTVWDEESAPSNLSVSAGASDLTLVPHGSIALSGITSNRTITIQPAAGRSGAAMITIMASDGNSSGSKTFTLRVTRPDTNAPPTLNPLADIILNEDSGSTNISLSGISAGVNESGQTLAVSAKSSNRDVVPDPSVNYTSPGSVGNLLLNPNPGTNGTASITVTVNDGRDTFARTFNVTIRARPVISFIADFAVDEDTPSAAIPFTVSDGETPAGNLVLAVISSNPSVIPVANALIGGFETNRTLIVTGALNQFGHSILTLTATDADGLSRTNSFSVTVNSVNDQPTLDPIAAVTMFEDQGSINTTITGISSGAPNETQLLVVHATSSNPGVVPAPAVSYASPNSSGTLTLSPVRNAYGSAMITVIVNDGQNTNHSVSRTFEVTVNAIDDPPTINPMADVVLEHDAGPHSVLLSGISAGHANEGQVVTIQAVSSNPVVVSNLTVSYAHPASIGTLTLTHNPGVSGVATITVSVSDGPNTVSRSFLVTVNPVPSMLAVGAITTQTIVEDSIAGPIEFYLNDAEQPLVELSALSSNPALVGATEITFGGSGTNRTITLVPQTNQFGSAIITIIARAGEHTASNAFQLVVTGVDDFPYYIQRVPDTVFMDEDSQLEVPFFIDDPETPAHTLVIGATPYNNLLFPPGSIVLWTYGGTSRSIILRPAPNQHGTALIELRVRDSAFQRTTNNFTVVVRPVEDPPVISSILDQVTLEDQEFEFGFFVDDVETAVSNLVITATSSDTNLLANDVFQYFNNGVTRLVRARPVLNQYGSNVITVTVHDEAGATASTSFNLRVLPVNDPPVISLIDLASTSVDQPTGQLPFTVGDVESQAEQLTLLGNSSNTNLAPIEGISFSGIGSNRTIRITPAQGQTGLALITVQVADPDGASSQTTFELLVNATSGPPVVVLHPQDQRLHAGGPASLRVLATGPGPLTYQWQKDGADLSGQTNATLAFASVQRTDRGAYRAVVTNPNGSVTSTAGNLEVFEVARIISVTRAGNTVQVVAESAIGQRYTLEFCDNLAAGIWNALNTIDGTGSPITFTDSAATPWSRFYRLRIE